MMTYYEPRIDFFDKAKKSLLDGCCYFFLKSSLLVLLAGRTSNVYFEVSINRKIFKQQN